MENYIAKYWIDTISSPTHYLIKSTSGNSIFCKISKSNSLEDLKKQFETTLVDIERR